MSLYDLLRPLITFARKPEPTNRFDLAYLSTIYLFKLFFKVAALMILLEVCFHIIHLGAKPVVPYGVYDQTPVMPANADFMVKLAGHPRARYITDDLGARVFAASFRDANCQGGVLAVGDSQALGWGIDFEDTFASRIAQVLLKDPGKARILAAPATDPEHNLHLLDRYRRVCRGTEKLTILTLNLGNDLDEMYLGRWESLPQASGRIASWLTMHSLLYVDATILKRNLEGSKEDLVPGVNSIMYALNPDEQNFLADRTAEVMLELVRHAGPSDSVVILVIPQDYQVDIKQMDKYKNFYDSEQEFNSWKAKIPEYSNRMNEIEQYISKRLVSGGAVVINFSAIARESGTPDELFDRSSHHLTPKAYQLVADKILASISASKL